MSIDYKTTHDFTPQQLERLFLSVEWSSGHYPEKLSAAMKNYETVVSAWDDDKLVGLICAMDDAVMTAYVHYLLVDPEYQGQSIGRTLVDAVKEKYSGYLRIVLISYNEEVGFYESCGFKREDNASPMCITTLWT